MLKQLFCIVIILSSNLIAIQTESFKKNREPDDGEKYKGSYKNGFKDGFGSWEHPDGYKYKGKFKKNLKHGKGRLTLPNGDVYWGTFKHDKKHGNGEYTYSNKDKYVGEYYKGIQEGKGYLVVKKDTTQSGVWEFNKFIELVPLKNIKSFLKNKYQIHPKVQSGVKLNSSLKIMLQKKKKELETGDTATLELTLTNNGDNTAYGIDIFPVNNLREKGIIFEQLNRIQMLKSGSRKILKTKIFATDSLITEDLEIKISVTEKNGFDTENIFSLTTRSLTNPVIVLERIKIKDQNNLNGKIEPAEVIEAKAFLKNMGQRVAKDITISIQFGSKVFNTGKSLFEIGDIKKNEIKQIDFSFFAMDKAGSKLPINFEVKDADGRLNELIPAGLSISKSDNN